MILTSEQWDRLWNSGVPVVLLIIGIVWLARVWRMDVENASKERVTNGLLIAALTKEIRDLKEQLSSFFLTHFP